MLNGGFESKTLNNLGTRESAILQYVKAFAIVGILLNHLVEEFVGGPWFTNPTETWQDLPTRLSTIWPTAGDSFLSNLIYFLGWLGDQGPGVFIVASGFGLTVSVFKQTPDSFNVGNFYRRRFSRILPTYMFVHALFLLVTPFVYVDERFSAGGTNNILSLIGIRHNDTLFTYLNPSWWFIWLIIQFYLVYPVLFKTMCRWGRLRFFVVILSITVMARGAGLLGFRHTENLYFWMTGAFFATRLAEFAFGMVAASAFLHGRIDLGQILSSRLSWLLAFVVYVLGLLFSFFWATTVLSNALTSIGLFLIFVKLGDTALSLPSWVQRLLVKTASLSFVIFLIHQPPLKLLTRLFNANPRLHLSLSLIAIAIAFPIGGVLLRVLGAVQQHMKRWSVRTSYVAVAVFAALVFAAIGFYRPAEYPAVITDLILIFLTIAGCGSLVAMATGAGRRLKRTSRDILVFTGSSALLLVAFFPMHPGYLVFLLSGIAIGVYLAARIFVKSHLRASTSTAVLVGGWLLGEVILTAWVPLESTHWGELPVLEKHPTLAYSLQANVVERLRYNNYDYTIVTNEIGMTVPPDQDIPVGDPEVRVLLIGDAFTMPEGIEYKSSYAARLQLNVDNYVDNSRVQVYNAGVTGYGPANHLPQLREVLPVVRPNIVIYQFFVDEFSNIEMHSIEAVQRRIGLLPHQDVSIRMLLETSQIVRRIAEFTGPTIERLTGAPVFWRYNKSLLAFYESNSSYYSENNVELLKDKLHEIRLLAEQYDSELLLLYTPSSVEVSDPRDIAYLPTTVDLSSEVYNFELPFETIRRLCTDIGITFLDPRSNLRKSTTQPVYFRESWHWNDQGHKIVGDFLFEKIVSKELLVSQM